MWSVWEMGVIGIREVIWRLCTIRSGDGIDEIVTNPMCMMLAGTWYIWGNLWWFWCAVGWRVKSKWCVTNLYESFFVVVVWHVSTNQFVEILVFCSSVLDFGFRLTMNYLLSRRCTSGTLLSRNRAFQTLIERILHHETHLKDIEMNRLLVSMGLGPSICDRIWFKMYNKCFVGSEYITWLITHNHAQCWARGEALERGCCTSWLETTS